jgi:hypothetical protein
MDKIKGEFKGDATIVPTETGYRVLDIGSPGHEFGKRVGQVVGGEKMGRHGLYEELPWKEGKVTETLNEAFGAEPNLKAHASSQSTREVARGLHSLYSKMAKEGKTPNPKIMTLLDTWANEGWGGVEKLIGTGAVPAATMLDVNGKKGAKNEHLSLGLPTAEELKKNMEAYLNKPSEEHENVLTSFLRKLKESQGKSWGELTQPEKTERIKNMPGTR